MSNNLPLVSIVSAYYNREEYVVDSIKSLLDQKYPNLEIIVIDDGSTDGTYQKLLSFADKRLKVITQSNQGFVQTIRRAVAESSGEFIAIRGSGDISFPGSIEKQAKVLIERDEIGFVDAYTELTDWVTGTSQICKPKVSQAFVKGLMLRNPFNHGGVMFRRSLYDAVGGYRTFFTFAQDADLWVRMSFLTEFYVVEEVLNRKFQLPDGVSKSPTKLLIRAYLGEIIRQCAMMRSQGKKDLVDEYGIYAGFFRKRNKRLAHNLLTLAFQTLTSSGDWGTTKRIVRLSVQEWRTLINSGAQIAFTILPMPILWSNIARKGINLRRKATMLCKQMSRPNSESS